MRVLVGGERDDGNESEVGVGIGVWKAEEGREKKEGRERTEAVSLALSLLSLISSDGWVGVGSVSLFGPSGLSVRGGWWATLSSTGGEGRDFGDSTVDSCSLVPLPLSKTLFISGW